MSNPDRKCSKCRRPLTDHPGKNGPSCTNPPLTGTEASNKKDSTGITGSNSREDVPVSNTEVYLTPTAVVSGAFNYGQGTHVMPVTVTTAPATTSEVANQAAMAQPTASNTPLSSTSPVGGSSSSGAVQTTTAPSRAGTTAPATGQIATPIIVQATNPQVIVPTPMSTIAQTFVNQSSTVPIWSTGIGNGDRSVASTMAATMVPTTSTMDTGVSLAHILQHMNILQSQVAHLQNQAALHNRGVMHPGLATYGTGTASQQPVISHAPAGITSHLSSIPVQTSNHRPVLGPNNNFTHNNGLVHYNLGGAAPMHPPGGAAQGVPLAAPGPIPAGFGAPPAVPQPITVPGLVPIDQLGDISQYITVPSLPERNAREALKGRYANLDDYLKHSTSIIDNEDDMQLVIDADSGVISQRRRRANRRVTNYMTWLEAYCAYEKMMVRAHGLNAYHAMADYKNHIQDCDRKFNWEYVYDFDIQHRMTLSGRSIEFMNLDTTMVASILDSSAIKQNAKMLQVQDH